MTASRKATLETIGLVTLIVVLFGSYFGAISFMARNIAAARKAHHDKIYNGCIADGQKPYYCESLASK